MTDDSQPAVILFAHGARDPRWAEPFERVARSRARPAPDVAVELAYLELLPPDLAEAARRLAAGGATAIRVVPLFFGRGGTCASSRAQLIARRPPPRCPGSRSSSARPLARMPP